MVDRRSLIGSAGRHALALALAPVGMAALAAEPGAPLPLLGSTLAVPALTLLDGSAWGPDQAQGKVLVVYWWASWCPFCALQSPAMEQLWRAQRERGLIGAVDVVAVGIEQHGILAQHRELVAEIRKPVDRKSVV